MNFEQIPENILHAISQDTDIVAENAAYLKSIGINKPEALISLKPELFILTNDEVKEMVKDLDIDKINKNPYSIIDMLG